MEIKEKAQNAYQLLHSFIHDVNVDKYEKMLSILKKIINNIINNPSEDKFRSIKKNNKVLSEKLFIHDKVSQALEMIGFAYDSSDQVFLFYEEDINILTTFDIILDGISVEIEAIRNNQNVDQQILKKRLDALQKEEDEKNKIFKNIEKEMMQDRAEKEQDLKDRPCQGSRGKTLQFGAKIKKLDLPPPSQGG